MTQPARHDPPARQFVPDPELVSRAQRYMLDTETERQRFLRQRAEDALGALRVALGCLREVCPFELDLLRDADATALASALDYVEGAYTVLDGLSPVLLGEIMDDVQAGRIDSHRQLDQFGVPQ